MKKQMEMGALACFSLHRLSFQGQKAEDFPVFPRVCLCFWGNEEPMITAGA